VNIVCLAIKGLGHEPFNLKKCEDVIVHYWCIYLKTTRGASASSKSPAGNEAAGAGAALPGAAGGGGGALRRRSATPRTMFIVSHPILLGLHHRRRHNRRHGCVRHERIENPYLLTPRIRIESNHQEFNLDFGGTKKRNTVVWSGMSDDFEEHEFCMCD
jgi:hypothetical protein